MKSILIIFSVLTFSTAFSQKHIIDFKGGLNFSKCSGSFPFSENASFRTRAVVGFGYEYHFANNLKVGTNLLYSQKGFNTRIDFFGFPFGNSREINYSFDYLSIPLKVGYEYGEKFFVYGNAGLTNSFLVSATFTEPALGMNFETVSKIEYKITEEVSTYDLGMLIEVGGGYKFDFGLGAFLETGFQKGFLSLTKDNFFSDYSMRNFNFSLQLGLRYQLK